MAVNQKAHRRSLPLLLDCLIVPPGDVRLGLSLLYGPPGLDGSQYRLHVILPEVLKPRHNTKARSWFPLKNPVPDLRVGVVPSMPCLVMGMRPTDATFAVTVSVARLAGCAIHPSSPRGYLSRGRLFPTRRGEVWWCCHFRSICLGRSICVATNPKPAAKAVIKPADLTLYTSTSCPFSPW